MKKFLSLIILLLIITGIYLINRFVAGNNINEARNSIYILIPTGSDFETVLSELRKAQMLKDEAGFAFVAKYKGYDKRVKPGKYIFAKSMNNREIVNMLKAGLQTKVKLNLYNIQTKGDFARLAGAALEPDSAEVADSLNSESFCRKYNCNTQNILTHFIYNIYYFKWNTAVDVLSEEFDKAYSEFWNEERLSKAAAYNLSPEEVTILASIVEKEAMKEKELERIAGVYLNRLRIGMPLQADPTLKFAAGDYDAKRVTNFHKEIESPYNTYKYRGLPPGPICIPRKKSIDAVLNAETHDYLYFCASPDMSGYSVFSKTLTEQNKIAALYRKRLDLMNIK